MSYSKLCSKFFLYFFSALSFLFLAGCASTWVEKSPALQQDKNIKVLVGHYSVESQGGADLFDLAKQTAGDGVSFADVSMETYELLKKSLSKFGFQLFTDSQRAKQLNHGIDLTSGSSRVDELIGSMASQWTHPDTSDKPFHRLFDSSGLRQKVVSKLKGSDKGELFLSADLKIEDQDQYLVFKRFRLTLSVQILDLNGEAVFQAKTEGFTKLKFLRNPISEQRIQSAMADALDKLEKTEVKNKISSFNSL